jgi:hypothetical protein
MAAINPPVWDVVPAGSTQSILRGLLPNTTYTAYVFHRDQPPDRSFSAPLVVTFTTAAPQATAATPLNPAGFAGRITEDGMLRVDGTYGIEVTPTEFPSTIVMESAVETALGSGVPGGFVYAGHDIASVASNDVINRTRIAAVAANDNLKRFVRAYATRRGAINSAYTAAITIFPWGEPSGAAAYEIAGVFTEDVSLSLL